VFAWLARDSEEIELAVSIDDSIAVAINPLEFISPVSYAEPEEMVISGLHCEDELEDE